MIQTKFKHPSGNIFIVSNEDNKIVMLDWVEDKSVKISKELNDLHFEVHHQIDLYFKKELIKFDFPFFLSGTDFQMKVWKYLSRIKYGSTLHYSDIAIAIGHPDATRAVGSAVGKNPICLLIPCHRVIPKSGQLGSFRSGPSIKQYLLRHEGRNF